MRDFGFSLLDKYLPKGGFYRGVVTLAGSVLLGQGLALLASPILTRLYSVADFGLLQIYLTILLFLLIVVAGRYELAIILPKEEKVAVDLVVLSLGLTLINSVLCALALLILPLDRWLTGDYSRLRPYLWFLPLSILGAGFYAVLAQWTLRQKNYTQVGRSKIFQGVGMVAVQIALGKWLSTGFIGLLAGDTVGRVFGITSFAKTAWRDQRNLFRIVTWQSMLAAAKRYRRFPLISGASSLVNSAGGAAPPLLIGGWFSSQVLGWYGLADRVLCAPNALIGNAISQVYTVEAARLAIEDLSALRALLLKTMTKLALIGFVPFAVMCVWGTPLFSFFFGHSWAEAGEYARWLGLMQYVSFVVWPVIPTLNILEHQDWQFFWDLGRMIVTFTAIAVCHHAGYSARSLIAAYSGAMLLAYVAHPLLSVYAILRLDRKKHPGLS